MRPAARDEVNTRKHFFKKKLFPYITSQVQKPNCGATKYALSIADRKGKVNYFFILAISNQARHSCYVTVKISDRKCWPGEENACGGFYASTASPLYFLSSYSSWRDLGKNRAFCHAFIAWKLKTLGRPP